MMIEELPPMRGPLNSVIFAGTSGMIGRASPRALPAPIFEPAGQPFTPRCRSRDGLQVLKYLALTTAPFGKRSVVFVNAGGFPPVSSLMRIVVLSVRPPRALCRSLFEYFAVRSTVWTTA